MNPSTATPSLLHFDNDEISTHIRAVEINDAPWFIAKDVGDSLGLSHIREATKSLDDDELMSVKLTAGGQKREMVVVNESGLYALVFKSTKPEARAFRKWVTSEVLPALRRQQQPGTLTAEILALLPPSARRACLHDEIGKLERTVQRLRTQADLALVIPGQMSVHHWLLLQGEEATGGMCGRMSGQCLRLANARGIEVGEVKVIEHMGQIVRLSRTAKTYPEEILAEVCGRAAA